MPDQHGERDQLREPMPMRAGLRVPARGGEALLCLVTGGAGFIGSNLVHRLVELGWQVRVLDNFSTGRWENLAEVEACVEIVEGDLTDPDDVREAMRGVSHVSHQGALPSVVRSVEDPRASVSVNVMGTLNVLNAAREAGVRRVVYASSSSVYGDNAVLPKREDMLPRPLSPYAAGKLAGEQLCRAFAASFGLETVCLRYFNVFGPRQDPASEYAAVIPRFVSAALRGEPVVIYGDGEQSRDFTYVDNVVAANVLALLRPSVESGLAMNIACGDRCSVNQLADLIGEIVGRPVSREHLPPRAGEVRHSQADTTLAGEHLGYRPRVPLRDGLERTIARYAAQPAPAAPTGSLRGGP